MRGVPGLVVLVREQVVDAAVVSFVHISPPPDSGFLGSSEAVLKVGAWCVDFDADKFPVHLVAVFDCESAEDFYSPHVTNCAGVP